MKYPLNRSIGVYGILGLVMLAMLAPSTIWAQAGGSAVPFLMIAPNARADGMGEAGAGLADDASAIHWNPAGLAFQTGREASLTHSNWLPQFQQPDLFYDYAAGKMYIEDIGGTVAGSITYLNLGEFTITKDSPTPLGTFKAYELAVTGAYATKVTSEFGVGINLRYIRDALAPFDVQGQGREGVANTFSVDLALMWKPTALTLPFIGNLEDRIAIGLNLSNLGPKVTYIDAAQADPLPTNLRIGFGIKVMKSEYNNVNLAIDFNRLLIARYAGIDDTTFDGEGNVLSIQHTDPRVDNLPKALITTWNQDVWRRFTVGAGIEYWYGAPKLIALRYGYFYEDPNNGGRRFMTFGAGIRYSIFGFDFSYLSTTGSDQTAPLNETLRFTLLVGDQE